MLILSSSLHAESFFAQFKDDDGWFDVSNYVLNNAAGFMPLPIIITEPAVDAGIGLAALFFHPPDDYAVRDDSNAEYADTEEFVIPNVTGVAAAITGNDSWFVGGGHFARWKGDTIRYEGVAGYASINLKYYGFPGASQFDDGIRFESEGFFTQHPISFRWQDSNVFFGASWDYYNIDTSIDLGLGIPEIDILELNVQLSGIDLMLTYDDLDNPFTPNTGIEAEISLGRKDEAIGSDFEYNVFEASVHKFWTLNDLLVLGLRLDGKSLDGDIPFFVLPFVELRGVPAMRYQGETVVVAETELRWSPHSRIGVVGFLGLGKVANSFGNIVDAPSRVTRGLGVRYFVARELGMHVGIDVAEGPEDTHWYLTFGQAW
jgi:hypothetical protein